jgi:bifunctional non-homologous end joining protein LigD
VRGEAGSGIDRRTASKLLERFEGLRASGPTAVGEYEAGEDRVHLSPEIVVRVRWHTWSESGRLRFPVFLGVRDDVDPRDCRAAPEAAKPLADGNRSLTLAAGKNADAANEERAPPAREQVLPGERPLPSRERQRAVVFECMLPYVAGRPLAIARTESDEAAPSWAAPRGAPSWLRVVDLPDRARARRATVVDGVDGLAYLASKGATSFFVAAARAASLDRADFFAVDLDGRAAPPKVLERVARAARAVCDDVGLPAFAMRLGKDVVRVLAPTGGVPWDASCAFAQLVARAVAAREPGRATCDRAVAKAGGRVLLDHAPSLPFAPLLVPWSPRPSGDAASPLDWATLAPISAGASAGAGPDLMLPLVSAAVDFAAAAQKVATLFR